MVYFKITMIFQGSSLCVWGEGPIFCRVGYNFFQGVQL